MPSNFANRLGLYEDSTDRAYEEQFRQFLQYHWQVLMFKRTVEERIDFSLHTPNLSWLGVLEFKRRYVPIRKYPTLFFDKSKFVAGQTMAALAGVPHYFAVWWDDALRVCQFTPYDVFDESVGGRWDRNDVNDVDLLVHVPIDRFVPFRDVGTGQIVSA